MRAGVHSRKVPKLKYRGKRYERRRGETVLDALMRQGETPPFSCRKGVCLVCLMRCESGEIPEEASERIQPRLRDKGYFLSCQAVPDADVAVDLPRDGDVFGRATVIDKTMLSADVCRLRLETATALYYHAGQFVNLRRPADGVVRSYSLASVPALDAYLELHVRRVRLGTMSNWILDELAVGEEVDLQGPEGRCFYRGADPEVPLLLIGTGTGLAPLYGIVRDALNSGHRGPIRLYHGVRDPRSLYLVDELRALAERHPAFEYHPCASGLDAELGDGVARGRASDRAFDAHRELDGWHVFLCGLPDLVAAARVAAIQAGAPVEEIRADPFETAAFDPETTEEPNRYPPPDPEMWAALEEGKLLRKILTDFYTQVYADPQLSPYFAHTTIQRSIGKQYEFLGRVFTGTLGYFGDRPRNAHHWMVISNALFDHRATLMQRTLRKHGLAEHLVRRFAALEEGYRRYIVKAKPWPRIMRGTTYPLDGYEEMTMTVGTLCDGCEGVVEPGDKVRYHVRLGTTFCASCFQTPTGPPQASMPPPSAEPPSVV